MIDFPNSPTDGQQFAAPNGVTYVWSAATGLWSVAPGSPVGQCVENILAASVPITAINTFVNGPAVTVGAAGQVWRIDGVAMLSQSGVGPDYYDVRIWNGAAAVGPTINITSPAASVNVCAKVMGVTGALAGSTTFTLQARDDTSTTGQMIGQSHIVAQRIS
jgi:hypothetical protein